MKIAYLKDQRAYEIVGETKEEAELLEQWVGECKSLDVRPDVSMATLPAGLGVKVKVLAGAKLETKLPPEKPTREGIWTYKGEPMLVIDSRRVGSRLVLPEFLAYSLLPEATGYEALSTDEFEAGHWKFRFPLSIFFAWFGLIQELRHREFMFEDKEAPE